MHNLIWDVSTIVGREVEKSLNLKYNVVSPDSICEEYGAAFPAVYTSVRLGFGANPSLGNTSGHPVGFIVFLKKVVSFIPLEG